MADKTIIEAEVKSNVGEVTKDVEKLNDSTKKASGGFGGMGKAIKGVGAALKAAGIGIIVGLLVKLGDVFRQNQKAIDVFNTAMEFLNIAFNDLFRFLQNNIGTVIGYFKDIFENPVQSIKNFGTAIKNNLIERFNSLLDTFGLLAKALKHLFAGEFKSALQSVKEAGRESVDVLTGVDNSVDKITETVTKGAKAIKEYAKDTKDAAENLVELNKAAELAAATNQKIIEQKDREAELQRQIRDDETKTFAERQAASEQLKTILDEQEAAMIANADAVTKAAQAQFNKNDSDANQIALIQAQTEAAGVLAQIEGFRSEQKLSAISLNKEEKQVAQDNADSQIEAFSGLAGALSGLAGENKELAAAGALIDTYAGANKAFAQGGITGFVTGAAIIAAGLSNLQKIYSTPIASSGGGSGGGASAVPQTPAPQMTSGAFELGGGLAPEPVKAFVVTDEMTNSQDQLANIRRRATI